MKIVDMKIKDIGCISFELWEENAPKAISQMLRMITLQKYDNKVIERFEPVFVLQPLFQDGIDDDIDVMVDLELNPDILFERGIVAMAGDSKNASGAQFFITLDRAKRLDGNFTVIGKVIDGYEIIEALEKKEVIEKIDEVSQLKYHQFIDDVIVESIRVR